MKKMPVLIANLVIVFLMMTFVTLYVRNGKRTQIIENTENFTSMTIGMELVTTNYLEGEQRLCDSWARYINDGFYTINEAIDYMKVVQAIQTNAAHIIFTDTLTGYSNRPNIYDPNKYAITYERTDLFSSIEDLCDESKTVHVTHSFTNPNNEIQSIGFCNRITLDDGNGNPREALIMRVVPLENISGRWTFPTDRYENAQISMIDAQGNYIIRGKDFTSNNFFDFYNASDQPESIRISDIESIVHTTGSFNAINSRGEKSLIVHVPINSASDWTILAYIPMSDIGQNNVDWLLIGTIALGLLLLLFMDVLVFMIFNKKLEVAVVAADSANRAKTDFLSTMSHDIRTPMNAIIGLTTIAERNVQDSSLVQDNLKKIRLASNHLLTLINDILDISKVESGKVNLSPVAFSIVDSAENLVNISQPMVRQKHIDFRFRSRDISHEYLYADQLRINQIFINILSNALKYTPEGNSVYVDLRENPSEKPEHIQLVYTVEDTGIGMSKDFMEKMYQPFVRETDSRINAIQGTGLGLAITKKMVDLMGGSIECNSETGRGTTFTVTLNIQTSDISEDEMTLPPLEVLVIDDDEVLLETAKDTLTALGTNVDVAESGESALQKISAKKEAESSYNVIILDWKMPGMSGLELTKKIRELVGKNIPILLVSAYDWSVIEDDAKEAGISGFISKPLFRSSLYKKISDVLGLEKDAAREEENNLDLTDMNILVAEDMDVNWEIISTLLGMYSIKTVRAENGQIAIDMLRSIEPAQYDAVFMDIQMPVMNGLEATRQIRKLENPYAAGIPIIAMTADAFSENVAECMEAGMNGHISKPIDIKLVIKELRKIRQAQPDFYSES